jgi:hypothetical protein
MCSRYLFYWGCKQLLELYCRNFLFINGSFCVFGVHQLPLGVLLCSVELDGVLAVSRGLLRLVHRNEFVPGVPCWVLPGDCRANVMQQLRGWHLRELWANLLHGLLVRLLPSDHRRTVVCG